MARPRFDVVGKSPFSTVQPYYSDSKSLQSDHDATRFLHEPKVFTIMMLQTLISLHQALPKPGAQVFQDNETIVSWSYDSASQTMVSYDTPQVVSQKIEYIKGTGLGGAMWWETSGDHPTSSKDSLITIAAEGLGEQGGHHMENSENFLDYPQSKYDNLRLGMPGE